MATIRKRGNSYQIRVSVGYDTKGNHKEQAMTWKPENGMTQRQIEKELNRQAVMFEEACMRGFKTSTIKFQDLAEEWFSEYASINLRSTTFEQMRGLTRRVYPAIGHLRLDKITPRQLQAFVNALAKDGKNEVTGKPLSSKTVIHHLCFISCVFSYAVRMGLISDNPCSKVSVKRGDVKEKQIYSQEEMALLLTRMENEPLKYKAFFYLMAYSGFRRGEMLGLEWKDIDFEHNIISIHRTSNKTSARGIYTDITKTKRSKRTLKISPYIMEMLRQLKDEQDTEALKCGDHWVDNDRLFTKDNGEPQHPNTTYTWLKRFCEREELPFHGLHSFRHFAASALISAGLDVTTVSGALGHCNSGTTLNVYSHMFQTAQARVAEAMDGAFGFLQNKQGA